MTELVRDAKEDASMTLAHVVRATQANFPDARYRPSLLRDAAVNARYGIDAGEHKISGNSDGTGTKPELAERLFTETGDSAYFERPAFDLVAMVADDVARDGSFVVGIINNLDVNTAGDPPFVAALSRGLRRACDVGRFPLLNGETAELGYRAPGYGSLHLNWNATALQLINERKMIDGSRLRPGQPIVGLRERSIRSNGLTRARRILEHAFLRIMRATDKRSYVAHHVREQLGGLLSEDVILRVLDATPAGTGFWEHQHLPWHKEFPWLTEQLLTPSTIYAPLIYEAQGGVDGDVQIPLVSCAHVSGGGVPLKGQRMLERSGLGMRLESPFPDPAGIPELIDLARRYPTSNGPLVTERTACDQWNRGVGFLCVTEHAGHASELAVLAAALGYEAAIVGETTNERAIEWRGERWTY